ncbi:Gfo/Idh/MocA family protein [Aurantimonas sp. VKM B-3413]|uniref:Gfo/Idh/MocA family oxidoreductase n=1 Tax=Aurantimonas sp. VKM B-3413 TaxID=2779401 RepID=UPI001E64015D|nr:Gfo/Idh/MocA family oxidoreductase [Aurantimonas sp. VKM B-3413]MCB8840467.1 Gfo/Idh/MocA family oxidoreductase [Aurantimonas sp. VKM B-3413]
MRGSPVRWAVCGTGGIAGRFAADMRFSRCGRIAAVASRDGGRARAFAASLGPDVVAGSLSQILSRDDIDAVYLATPNATHAELGLEILSAGKPLMVEKPLATRAEDAERIAAAARERGLLAMEAMWMRFTPGIVLMRRWLGEGRIGEIRSVTAGLGFANAYRRDAALFDPVHGGALLDLGVYAVSLAQMVAGPVRSISAGTIRADNGAVVAASLSGVHRATLSNLSCSLREEGANDAVITGSRGFIRLHRPFFCPPMVTMRTTPEAEAAIGSEEARGHSAAVPSRSGFTARLGSLRQIASGLKAKRVPTLFEGTGLHYQADHFAECLEAGLTDSPVMPLADTIAALRVIEAAMAPGSQGAVLEA